MGSEGIGNERLQNAKNGTEMPLNHINTLGVAAYGASPNNPKPGVISFRSSSFVGSMLQC